MNHTVSNGVLIVSPDAKPKTGSGFGYDITKSLAENIAYGYGKQDFWFNKPRNFPEEARGAIRDGRGHIELMKKYLQHNLKGAIVT